MYCWMQGKESEGWGVEQEWNERLIGSGKVRGQIQVGVISGYGGRHASPVYSKYMRGEVNICGLKSEGKHFKRWAVGSSLSESLSTVN